MLSRHIFAAYPVSDLPYAFYGLYAQSTYILRVQSCVWRLPKYWPFTPFSPYRVCPPPAPKAGGTHSPGGEGDGGSIFGRRQPQDWLLTIISLRLYGTKIFPKICILWSPVFQINVFLLTIVSSLTKKIPISKNFHLSPVSLTPVIILYFRIAPRILVKIRNVPHGILSGPGDIGS